MDHSRDHSATTTRVIIVDDDLYVRTSLARELDTVPTITVAGVYSDGIQAVRQVLADRPQVALVDIAMPILDGPETTRRLKEADPSIHVLALTSLTDSKSAAEMVAAGAAGFLPKDLPVDAIAYAVQAARHGVAVLAGPGVDLIGNDHRPDLALFLNDTERQILQLIGQGMTTNQIAQQVYLAPSTVKYHITALLRKLGATNRVTLAVRAHELGIR